MLVWSKNRFNSPSGNSIDPFRSFRACLKKLALFFTFSYHSLRYSSLIISASKISVLRYRLRFLLIT